VGCDTSARQWIEQRDSFPADLIKREVVAKGRRALAIWGSGHLQRQNRLTNDQMDNPLAGTLVSFLESRGVSVFIVVEGGEEEVAVRAGWPAPRLALVRGTTLGAANDSMTGQRFAIRDKQIVPIPREQWITKRVEDQLDAVIWIGPASGKTQVPLSPALCTAEYLERREKRRAIAGLPPVDASDRLNQYCATLKK
jgi:hypothetical protein